MDIIIFGGQSNMQGQTERLSDNSIIENAFEYKWLEDYLVPLQNPVGENIKYDKTLGDLTYPGMKGRPWVEKHALGAACYGYTNMVPKFCEAYLKNKAEMTKNTENSTQVMAVHAAKGSTKIEEWLPGTEGYKFLAGKALAAIEYAKKADAVIDHIYFVWLQGESDAMAEISKALYKERMVCLKNALKNDLKIEKFGVIRVGRFANDERDWEIIHAQSEICNEDEDFLMLTEIATELNKEQVYMNPNVKGHYSAFGLETLGTISGEVLGKYAVLEK